MYKYYQMLDKILREGKVQENRKGRICYLLNERLMLTPGDLLDIFESHGIARKKLKAELCLFMRGERDVEKYREAGITWWDYCGHTLVNSYPTYLEKLPPLVAKINAEKRSSKNYVLFLGATGVESNQAACLSLVQFQIDGVGWSYRPTNAAVTQISVCLPTSITYISCRGRSNSLCSL